MQAEIFSKAAISAAIKNLAEQIAELEGNFEIDQASAKERELQAYGYCIAMRSIDREAGKAKIYLSRI